MSKSLSFRFQLSSIMEIMTKTAIEEICKIVESEFTLIRQELSFVKSENRVLKDKMRCMESKAESTRITNEETASISYQSTCVQTEGVQPSINEPNSFIQPLIKEENRSEVDTDPNYEDKASQASEGLLNSSVCEPSTDSKKYNHHFESDEIQRKAFHSSDEHSVKNTFSVKQNVPCPSETQKDEALQELCADTATTPENDESRFKLHNQPGQEEETVKPKLRCYEGKMILSPNATKQQVTKHKQQPPVKVSKLQPNKRYHCEICGREFNSKAKLKIHSVVHTGERPHKCRFCGKKFTQGGRLQIHERIHKKERPFTCDTCGMTFAQKITLDKHLPVHNRATKKKQKKSK